jgi:hypothetical protein
MSTQPIYTCEAWQEMITAMHSGERIQIEEAVYDYFLEVLPPVYMGRRITLPGGDTRTVGFGFAEGAEPITAFWCEGNRDAGWSFYCQRTEEMNRG